MFRIKICGITSVDDARVAAESGADAIGLNFYRASPRFVSMAVAKEIVAITPASVTTVGVVVDQSAENIRNLVDELGLNFIQLHGNEPAALIGQLGASRIIRAIRANSTVDVQRQLDELRSLDCEPAAVLVDAHARGQFGGTGQQLDWERMANEEMQLGGVPLILAGGLKRDNVGQAIDLVNPWGVDTASGVESRPGLKDPELVRDFVANAKQALDRQKNGR